MAGYRLSASAAFRAIGSEHRITVTNPWTLQDALRIATGHLAELDAAVSRFRPDSEVSRLAAQPADLPDGRRRAHLSPFLAGYVQAALAEAHWTGGRVDPTLGRAMVAAGYDADIDVVRRRGGTGAAEDLPPVTYRDLELAGDRLTMPAGTLLDLGATAKARAADVIAATCAARLSGGFLVSLGGDCAVAGDPLDGGWPVALRRHDGSTAQLLRTQQAVATSSTRLRTWRVGERTAHHILDPATRLPAEATWSTVTCLADTAVRANAASTAAVVLGREAPQWLLERRIPARLEDEQGHVVILPGWLGTSEKPTGTLQAVTA